MVLAVCTYELKEGQVVADGFYILTELLTSGNHTVHYKSSLSCPDVGLCRAGVRTRYKI
jgi:hypothetical protein